jgi:hypothetical protein
MTVSLVKAIAIDIESVITAFIECGLWAGIDWEDGTSGGNMTRRHILDETDIRTQVTDFVTGVVSDRGPGIFAGMAPAQIGHDFWLTRNRHGAGFWDRGLGERGQYLTDASHPYGECRFQAVELLPNLFRLDYIG